LPDRQAGTPLRLKPEIELDSLGPTLDLVRKNDWATILPVVAVKQAADGKLLRIQRIINPTIPREVIVASRNSHNQRMPRSQAGSSPRRCRSTSS
jgi:DNA-binding transcriptional LysR family regulator